MAPQMQHNGAGVGVLQRNVAARGFGEARSLSEVYVTD